MARTTNRLAGRTTKPDRARLERRGVTADLGKGVFSAAVGVESGSSEQRRCAAQYPAGRLSRQQRRSGGMGLFAGTTFSLVGVTGLRIASTSGAGPGTKGA